VNIQEYISSGIVETYVLGLASRDEQLEFEQLAAIHPELQQAREVFEMSLEQHAMDSGVKPPAEVKVRFLEAIGTTTRNNPSLNQTKIITMQNENVPVRRAGWYGPVAAAAVILAIGLGWYAWHINEQNKELQAANSVLKVKADSSENVLNQIAGEYEAAKKHNVTVVNMVGTKIAPKSSANVFWDSTSQSVYMVVKNMPKLPNDKQYQLWALINGKPKDLGVFDVSDEKFIIKMNNTQKADAFAITIEQKGGSQSPTLEKMESMGKTKATQ
jgi:anti-sigma-K factor RskA